ncbi:Neuropilin and tolloid-like protein 2 [Tribolium castaneum]|uniref:Neuropilin and tolloid-like protein 2 n=1 Tax=Tribolium castaneum TaxID=7070 RepID=A0A139WG07_TRICA|nr:Neuropilin and tolloid-like protein 2 [Tribolium castaneum]
MEGSPDCANDFLEIRDGLHGYNQLIEKKFCGKEFPPVIESSDRYLWIHFSSDENIEYKGFRAVYEFLPRPTGWLVPDIPICHLKKLLMEEGNITKSDIPAEIVEFRNKYKVATDCIWEVRVKDYQRIQLQFKEFDLDKPNECDKNFVQVFSTNTDLPSEEKKFCGSIADTVFSKKNVMFVRFFAVFNSTEESHFEANFTAYRDIDKQSGDKKQDKCTSEEFSCEDATCISKELRCNGRYNCRFRWDEDNCPGAQTLTLNDDHIIVIMVIFSLILAGMCFTFVFNCVKKLIRDHQTIQEYIRQSREQQLNELDKQEPTEKKLSKSVSRSRSNSSPSMNSGHFDVANAATTPCYVPGGELLPILIRNERSMSPPNGDAYHTNIYTAMAVIALNSLCCPLSTASRPGDTHGELTAKLQEMPQSDASAEPDIPRTDPCYRFILGDRDKHEFYSPGFEDKPNYTNNTNCVDNEPLPEMCDSACQTRESLFTTQGYSSGNSTPNHSVHTNSPPAPFSTFGYKKDAKFKAEAKIEVAAKKSSKFEDKRRPYSVQTTKSAPDVIVTH